VEYEQREISETPEVDLL